jgi:hypothetical protein
MPSYASTSSWYRYKQTRRNVPKRKENKENKKIENRGFGLVEENGDLGETGADGQPSR